VSYPDVATSGQLVQWRSWDQAFANDVTIRWENHGWVAQGVVSRERVEFVIRMNAAWKMSQFLLFRDLPEPDLWLGTDGSGRWGEINGAHRPELDGCLDVELACTPFTATLPIRRLGLSDGFAAEILVAVVDVDTLQVTPQRREYTRLTVDAWTCRDCQTGEVAELAVDEFGLVRDVAGRWRRLDQVQ
jgi:hypothetical protein